MKAKELKLGDWVAYHGNSKVKVVELKEGDCRFLDVAECYTFIGGVNHAEPIPITEDILEYNGWIYCRGNGLMFDGWKKFGLVLVPNKRRTTYTVFIENIVHATEVNNIKYLHELQHLLWALGLDDDLKLPSY